MKKTFIISVAVIMLLISSIIVCANTINVVEGYKSDYSIMLNSTQISKDVPNVVIEDRIYVQLRSLCEILGFDIRWDASKNEAQVLADVCESGEKIQLGYYGINGWEDNTIDFELSKDVALSIADNVFTSVKGENFLSETVIDLDDDENYYYVYRYCTKDDIPIPGDCFTVVIRKNNGKIVRVEVGE